MIIKRQREFGKKIELIRAGLELGNKGRGVLEKFSFNSNAKEIARSLNKKFEAERIKLLKEEYAQNPKLLAEKLKELKSKRRFRLKKYASEARKKFDSYTTVKTEEQIGSRSQNLSDSLTPKKITEKVVRTVVDLPRTIVTGAKNAYNNAGQIITNSGALLRAHPAPMVGWTSGDVFNAGAVLSGHPELTPIPVGSILGGTLLTMEKSLIPRNTRRVWRQNGIAFRKRQEAAGKNRRNLSQVATDTVMRTRRLLRNISPVTTYNTRLAYT